MTKYLRLAVLIPFLFVASCKQKVTEDNFKLIKVGMTLNEVQAFLGKGEKLEQEGRGIESYGVGSPGKTNKDQDVWLFKEDSREITITVKAGKVIDMNKIGF